MEDHSLSENVSATEEKWVTRALVQELMNQLPKQYRQVLEFRIIEGYSYHGINGQLPIDFGSLKVTTNTGTDAVIQISEGQIKTVLQ